MSILEAIVLGVIEGVTEFLPISSTGHLTIAEKLMGHSPAGLFGCTARMVSTEAARKQASD